jgi:hypothetical protein
MVTNPVASGVRVQADVTDVLPAGLTNVSWQCGGTLGTSSSICGSVTHTGDIHETATLEAGGDVNYTVTATVAAGATGSITNSASITYAGDPNTSNNSATDTDTVYPPASLVFDPGLESGDWGISVIGHGLKPGATLYACENGVGCHAEAPSDVPDANGDLTLPGPLFACGIPSNYFPIYYETLTAAGTVIDSNQVTVAPC